MIYLASPYTHQDRAVSESRFDRACRAAGRLMSQGAFVYSPIAHSHPIAMRCALPTEFAYWQALDEAMIDACDEVQVLELPGWDASHGVQSEIRYAYRTRKPVRFVQEHPADAAAALRRAKQ